jgi:glycosyltransferase involved in cell wall biosynthesis
VAAEQQKLPILSLKGGIRWSLVSELSARLLERKGCLLCTHGYKANIVGYLATRKTNTPHVAFVRGWTAEDLRVAIYERLERQVLGRVQWVVCVSQKQADELASKRRHSSMPIVITNAMLPPYKRDNGSSGPSRERLNIPDSAFVFGSVGRLSIEKGHRILLSAFHRLVGETGGGVPLFLILLGDGKQLTSLENQATELGIRDKIMFAGFQADCMPWMQLLDCLVQPSLTEGTPNSILEAMFLGIPVVATAVGGVPDLIKDGRNGLLTASENPEQLAECMKAMLDSADLRRRLIAGGLETKDLYSSERQRDKLIAVYERALKPAGALEGTIAAVR